MKTLAVGQMAPRRHNIDLYQLNWSAAVPKEKMQMIRRRFASNVRVQLKRNECGFVANCIVCRLKVVSIVYLVSSSSYDFLKSSKNPLNLQLHCG